MPYNTTLLFLVLYCCCREHVVYGLENVLLIQSLGVSLYWTEINLVVLENSDLKHFSYIHN